VASTRPTFIFQPSIDSPVAARSGRDLIQPDQGIHVPKAAKYIGDPAPAPGRGQGAVAADDDADDAADVSAAGTSAALLRLRVTAAQDGWRLDRALAALLPEISRSRLQQWIAEGAVRLLPPRPQAPRARDPVLAGDEIELTPQPAADALAFTPEPMALAIVHEDAAIVVLDKPPGLVVHPAAGHWQGTLLNGLLAHDPQLARVPRAGIVHRLDADTSGLMVVARTIAAQTELVRQLQARSVTREYWAVVWGEVPEAGTIDAPIARDPRNPLRFAVCHAAAAREARTHFRRVERVECDGRVFSWVACRLETGRTHQIRVHLEHLGHPLVGDQVYRRGRPAPGRSDTVPVWVAFARQALHACRLGLRHPTSGEAMQWFRPPPADMRALMKALGMGRTDRPRRVFE
jgi:23S rRNA pseudouridine1911/1915/1917 synthase